jgi:hypothetical protein
LNSGENMLAERLPLNFVLIEFKLLLAEKRWEGLLRNRLVTILCPPF